MQPEINDALYAPQDYGPIECIIYFYFYLLISVCEKETDKQTRQTERWGCTSCAVWRSESVLSFFFLMQASS